MILYRISILPTRLLRVPSKRYYTVPNRSKSAGKRIGPFFNFLRKRTFQFLVIFRVNVGFSWCDRCLTYLGVRKWKKKLVNIIHIVRIRKGVRMTVYFSGTYNPEVCGFIFRILDICPNTRMIYVWVNYNVNRCVMS